MRRTGSAMLTGLLTLVLAGCHLEQVQIGQLIRFQSPPVGACPVMTWQFVVDARRVISGDMLHDGMVIGRIRGTLNPDDTFRMEITPVGHDGSATVTGTVTSAITTIAIAGDGLGSGCNGAVYHLQLRNAFQGPPLHGGGSR